MITFSNKKILSCVLVSSLALSCCFCKAEEVQRSTAEKVALGLVGGAGIGAFVAGLANSQENWGPLAVFGGFFTAVLSLGALFGQRSGHSHHVCDGTCSCDNHSSSFSQSGCGQCCGCGSGWACSSNWPPYPSCGTEVYSYEEYREERTPEVTQTVINNSTTNIHADKVSVQTDGPVQVDTQNTVVYTPEATVNTAGDVTVNAYTCDQFERQLEYMDTQY